MLLGLACAWLCPVLILAAILDLVLVLVFRRKCILLLVIFILLSFSLVFVDENSEHFSLVLVDKVSLHFSLVLVTLNKKLSPSYSHIKLLSIPSQAWGPLVLCLQLHNSQACS